MIALCSKTYFCFGAEDKFSCKGVNRKTNNVIKEKYMDVLLTKQSGSGTNRGFRTIDNQVYTYLQERAGFTYFYPKQKVLADGVSTAPLEIWGERHTMHIAYVYSWRKKEKRYQKDWYQEKKKSERLIKKRKKKLMQPLSIEPVTSLDKCRVAFLIERAQPITSQEI